MKISSTYKVHSLQRWKQIVLSSFLIFQQHLFFFHRIGCLVFYIDYMNSNDFGNDRWNSNLSKYISSFRCTFEAPWSTHRTLGPLETLNERAHPLETLTVHADPLELLTVRAHLLETLTVRADLLELLTVRADFFELLIQRLDLLWAAHCTFPTKTQFKIKYKPRR